MRATQPLAADFPTYSEADWRAAIARSRRTADGRAGTADEAALPLFRRRSDALPLAPDRPLAGWSIVQRIDASSTADALAQLNEAIAGGAGGAAFAFADCVHPLGGGIPTSAAPAIGKALREQRPRNLALRIETCDPATVAIFSPLARDGVTVSVAGDPIAAAATGAIDLGDVAAAIAAWVEIDGVAAIADGRAWHAAGASDAQELGVVLATFVELLRHAGTAPRAQLMLVADSDQFATIAKFRAARLLTMRMAELTQLAGPLPAIHAETAWRTMSRLEPETNMLRAGSAAFGAAAGGADSISVLPFDALGDNSADGRRLARNTSSIMAEEASLADVADPGAGSGAIETTTERLAEAAWREFQEIEAAGGIVAALADGRLLAAIARERDARLAAVADGNVRMIGVNAFRADGSAGAPRVPAPSRSDDRLRFVRLAEAFE